LIIRAKNVFHVEAANGIDMQIFLEGRHSPSSNPLEKMVARPNRACPVFSETVWREERFSRALPLFPLPRPRSAGAPTSTYAVPAHFHPSAP
jgi:hypothetical protein